METALISLILQLLPVFEALGKTIQNAIDKARQAGELTPTQEAEFQRRLGEVFSQPYAQAKPAAAISGELIPPP